MSIKSNPDASVYWSNGSKATTMDWVTHKSTFDENGDVKVYVSKALFKKYKKTVVIAKAGYEPKEFKLKWDSKKVQTCMLTKPAKHQAQEYYALAQEAKSDKKKRELLRAALFQDPENDANVGLAAINQLGMLEYMNKNYIEAQYYALSAQNINPKDSTALAIYQSAQQALSAKMNKNMLRVQKLRKYNQNAQAWLQWGQNTSAMFSKQPTEGSAPSYDKQSSKHKKQSNAKQSNDTNLGSYRAENKAYSGYSDDLHRMKSGLDAYNDAERRNKQNKMRSIRENWNRKHSGGLTITKDPIEDWNGSK